MNLTLHELLAYAHEEQDRWTRWFAQHGDAPLAFKTGGEAIPTVGALLKHTLGAQLWLAESLLDRPHTDWWTMPDSAPAPLLELGLTGKRILAEWLATASDADGARKILLPFPGGQFEASARKVAANALVHEIRHWAQVTMLVRQNGIAPPGEHDLMLSHALD